MKFKSLAVVALAALIVTPAFAQDDAKSKRKGKQNRRQNVATALVKQLEPVGLSDDQVAKIKQLGEKAAAEMKSIRDAAGITAELTKKRAEVQKSMKESDKKGKELIAAINEAAGFTAAHAEGLKKANAVRMKFQKDVIALLSDEQKEKLPERLQRALKAGQRKAKTNKNQAKKKKDAA